MASVLLLGDFGGGDPVAGEVLASCCEAFASHRIVVASGSALGSGAAAMTEIDPRRSVDLYRGLLEVDALVVAGGVLFASATPDGRDRSLPSRPLLGIAEKAAMFAKLLRKRVVLLGVSAGSLRFDRDRRRARRLVRGADLVVLAEPASAEILTAAGVPTPFRIGADLSWLTMPPARPRAQPSDLVTVTVARDALPRVGPWLIAALQPIVDAGLALRLQPWLPTDCRVVAETAERLGGEVDVVAPAATVVAFQQNLESSAVVVAMTYGALLAAAGSGRPVVSVATEPRTAGVAGRLAQVSLPVDAGPGQVVEAVALARAAGPPRGDVIQAEIDRAKASFGLVDLLLHVGDATPGLVPSLPLGPTPWLR